ncbi:MAG: type II secretion system F family protein [Burkholderiales bacterium]|nr:MAG: type II secretion system F family protein [Burkholderiales bacterium]
MPAYEYSGRDASGASVSGTLDVGSPEAAASALLGRGITPVRIEPAQAQASGSAGGIRLFGERGHLSSVELQMFSRQLHALLRAGLPILRALGAMKDSATRPALGRLMEQLTSSLDQGREFSAALARHPKDFPALYLAMIRVGEQTGRLDDVLKRLGDWLEFERRTRERVQAALRYPGFVITAMLLALVVVNLFVIPRFASVYRGMRVDLPWITQILIGISEFVTVAWPALLATVAIAVFGFRGWRRTDAGLLAWDRFALTLPVAGRILRNAALGRFARSLGMTLRSGLPAAQGIGLVAQSVGNAYIARRLERVHGGIDRGESLLRACAGTEAFTPLVLQMIAVGEESGALDEMLDHVADFYEQDVEYDVQRLSSAIEPILVTVLGMVVLVLALGVFLPIWDLGQATLSRGGA